MLFQDFSGSRDQNLRWSDYIFANGKRIARADGYEHQLHLSGQMCANCGRQWYQWGFSNLGSLVGHVVQAGDKLRWRQWLNTGSKGGLIMTMTDGTETWMNGFDILDQNGEEALRSSIYNQWNYRIADLSPLIGKTISQVRLIADGLSTPGQWDMWVEDVVYTQTDGTVQPLYSQGATAPSLYTLGSSGWTNTSASITDCTSGCAIANTTTYYHEDQINSSRLISDGYGYPIWQATFLPYGEEYGPQIGANHYKFSGKPWDSESGLDYFGARYYTSGLGRFLSPDWSVKPVSVPYADFKDPQSLNLYTYVRNRPTVLGDSDGHKDEGCPKGSSECTISTTTTITVGASSPFGGDAIVNVTQTTTTSYTDQDGNKVDKVNTTQTEARYSSEKGKEGTFLGASSKTNTFEVVNGKLGDFHEGEWQKSGATASDIVKMMGPKAGQAMNAVGRVIKPDLYWGAAKAAAQHPWETLERAASAGGLVACLVITGCAVGLAGAAAGGLGIVEGISGIMNGLTGR